MRSLFGLVAALCVLVCVMGCGKLSGGGGTANTAGPSNSANSAESAPVKALDIASIVGKSPDDIKKVLGPPTRESGGAAPSYTWELPQGDLFVNADYKDKKKVDFMTFTSKIIVVGNQTAQGYATYDKLGDLIGFDTRGKTPTSEESGDTGTTRFEKVNLGGTTVDEISFSKVSGKFISVTVRAKRGY
jgi:hypothetical protein